MSHTTDDSKPTDIILVIIALFLWTIWTCVYGIYNTQQQIPEFMDMVSQVPDFQMPTTPENLFRIAEIMYVFIAIVSAWVLVGIGQGKQWARSTVLWSLIIQVACDAFGYTMGMFHLDMTDAPDFGLQLFAVWLLYKPRNKGWFKEPQKT